MIIFAPLLVTDSRPVTNAAVLNRVWISLMLRQLRRDEILFDLAKESEISLDEKLLRPRATAQHHVHVIRHDSLNGREQVRIETELNNRSGLGRARELGFDYFIRKRSGLVGLIDPDEKVRPPIPLDCAGVFRVGKWN